MEPRASAVVKNLLTHLSIWINALHCDVNYRLGFLGFLLSDWEFRQGWIMWRGFLMVAHNFTDQWALSIVVKEKVEFVMGPSLMFFSHCSTRTGPFESHRAAKQHLWNTDQLSVMCLHPLVWFSTSDFTPSRVWGARHQTTATQADVLPVGKMSSVWSDYGKKT